MELWLGHPAGWQGHFLEPCGFAKALLGDDDLVLIHIGCHSQWPGGLRSVLNNRFESEQPELKWMRIFFGGLVPGFGSLDDVDSETPNSTATVQTRRTDQKRLPALPGPHPCIKPFWLRIASKLDS